MNNETGYDFGKVEAPINKGFLQPGQYSLSVRGAEFVKPKEKKEDGSLKTPYLDITFGCDLGEIKERFFITPKTLGRLQYLFLGWFDKRNEKAFESADGVGMFYQKVFNDDKAKAIVKKVLIAGEQQPNGKVYAKLPYSNYVLPDDMNVVEGSFTSGSNEYIQNVRLSATNIASDNVMLPSNSKVEDDSYDSLPF